MTEGKREISLYPNQKTHVPLDVGGTETMRTLAVDPCVEKGFVLFNFFCPLFFTMHVPPAIV